MLDLAQTFTVGISGKLIGIDVWVSRYTATEPLIYDVRRTFGHMPSADDFGSNILASGVIDATELETDAGNLGTPPSMLAHLDLSGARPAVEQGDSLAIVLRSFDQGPRTSYIARGGTGDPYGGGAMYRRWAGNNQQWELSRDWDLVFQTHVIPEPVSVFLLMLGATGLVLVRPVPCSHPKGMSM
jgi:hypothetical protein